MKSAEKGSVSWNKLATCCLVLLWPQAVRDAEGYLLMLKALTEMAAPFAGIYIVDVLLQNMGVERNHATW